MATTSGTFNFGSTISEQLIVDAYERIGILPDLITAQNIQTAIRSANLLLSEWINKGLNQWTVKQEMLTLVPNQSSYLLPVATSAVLEANVRQVNRQLGGEPYSSAGGNAGYAFDGNPQTACIQTAPNGYISYNYGTGAQQSINVVGIQSNVQTTYTLVFETSNDNVNWSPAASIPAQIFPQGVNVWFSVPVPSATQYFRVRETGGSTLNVQELYFDTIQYDIPITAISRAEYFAIPNKSQVGKPSSYYLDRQNNPILYLWLTPNASYNNISYTRVRMMEDIGSMNYIPDVPQRFFEALSAGLAFKLAIKYKPERVDLLKREYDISFNLAAAEDTERVPLRIYGDYMGGWTYVS